MQLLSSQIGRIVLCAKPIGCGRQTEMGVHEEREPIMGIWGRSSQWGPRVEPLVRGSGSEAPWSWKASTFVRSMEAGSYSEVYNKHPPIVLISISPYQYEPSISVYYQWYSIVFYMYRPTYWAIFSNSAVQLFSCKYLTIKLSWVELSYGHT